MKTIEEIKKEEASVCEQEKGKKPSKYIKEKLVFLRNIILYLEHSPTREFVEKQIDYNYKRLQAIESELSATISRSGAYAGRILQKKLDTESERLRKQNYMLDYILGRQA